MSSILEVKALTIQHSSSDLRLVHPMSLTLNKGEVLALVGASGSGKSLVAQALLHILPANLTWKGEISFRGNILNDKNIHQYRGKSMVYIPQSVDALDPFLKIGKQLKQLTPTHLGRKEIIEALKELGLQKGVLSKYPFELSGGQARRVLVLIALMSEAELIVADEPTPGIGEQATDDFSKLLISKRDNGKAVFLITHDLELATRVATKIAVMKDGKMVDIIPASWLRKDSAEVKNLHPYTLELWNSLPKNLDAKRWLHATRPSN